MPVYVDPLMTHGWKMRGRPVRNCHMFTDEATLDELHRVAAAIGMKRSWFQDERVKHYDLTPTRRLAAIAAGAIEVERREAVRIWRAAGASAALNP